MHKKTNTLTKFYKQTFAYLFVLLLLGSVSIKIFCTHSHTYDGNIIVHAHPYKSSEKNHTHSLETLIFIQNISIQFFVCFFLFVFLNKILNYIILQPNFSILDNFEILIENKRAPPSYLVIS